MWNFKVLVKEISRDLSTLALVVSQIYWPAPFRSY